MKLAERVKRMAAGFERQAAKLNAYLTSEDANNKDMARIKFMVMSDVYATTAASLRELEGAEKQFALRRLGQMTDDLRLNMDECATLAEAAALGGTSEDEHERIVQDARGREYARILQQLETLKKLDRDDR